MRSDEARKLLGFSPDSHPLPSEVKAAYIRKVWESHPDRFPAHEKSQAESKFKLISEAYSCLQAALLEGFHLGVGEQIYCMAQVFSGKYRRELIICIAVPVAVFITMFVTGPRAGSPVKATTVRVVRTGVPRASGRCNSAWIKAPFLLIILGTVSLGGLHGARAYQKQKEASLSHNPFLP